MGQSNFKIYSSTFARAKETAEIINETLKVGVIFDNRLRERMNWGSIPNQTLEEFLKEWEYSNFHREFKPKVGHSSLQSGKDALDVISEISTSLPDSNVAIITHGGVICDLLRNLFSDNELRKFISDFPEQLDKLIKECSITTLIKTEIIISKIHHFLLSSRLSLKTRNAATVAIIGTSRPQCSFVSIRILCAHGHPPAFTTLFVAG